MEKLPHRLMLGHVVDLAAQGGGGAHLDGGDGVVGCEEASVGQPSRGLLLVWAHQDAGVGRPQTCHKGKSNSCYYCRVTLTFHHYYREFKA